MNSLANSLRCLKHPAALFSIGLLLLNDHVLKVAAPSWLTGKLSDFAGLFFFPFVLAAALSVITDRLQFSTRKVGWMAFGITAAWFALMKTTAWGNALTEDLLARLLGFPAQIVLDPTDLIALPMLIPAWRLWNRAEKAQASQLGWIALVVASLATLATAPVPGVPVIKSLAIQDGMTYAFAQDGRSLAFSSDGGRTWDRVSASASVQSRTVQLPLSVCDSSNSQICYRIAQPEQVEQSEDGGQTWHVAWSIPPGRRDYMVRRATWCPGWCKYSLDLGPYDMILADPIGQNGLRTLVVAFGSDGVLVHSPDGLWQRYAVLQAQPTDFAARDLDEAVKILDRETKVWIITALAILFGLTYYGARIVRSGRNSYYRWAMTPLNVSIAAMIGLYAVAFVGFLIISNMNALSYLSYLFGTFITLLFEMTGIGFMLFFLPIIGAIGTWMRIVGVASQTNLAWRIGLLGLLTPIAVFLLGDSVLILWAFGVISEYGTARIISIALASLVAVLGVRQMHEQAMRTATPPTSS